MGYYNDDKMLCQYYGEKNMNYDSMLNLKYKFGFNLYFLVDGIRDIKADSHLGGNILEYKVYRSIAGKPLIENDYGVNSIQYQMQLKRGVTWLEIWSIMDSIVKKYELDYTIIRQINTKKPYREGYLRKIMPILLPLW